eukprot:TRINITY_DN63245_c0_g1_i2.p1 TRINITY_DN63245_c0_g1~~TRINITY_DN63245_c0_g1_i2.p1  ORF type:complete len:906 (-),score=71.36 TRINITY_DN63245_c0_g1_i2:117-2834(-)
MSSRPGFQDIADIDDDCELEDKKEPGETDFLNVEGDGVLDVIYECLWTKWDDMDLKLDMVIPDTVVFKFNKPIAWYFTRVLRSGGKIIPKLHKKKDSMLRNKNILAAFLHTTSKNVSEIVAYFISICKPDQPAVPGGEPTGKVFTRITYFNRQDLETFLLMREERDDGILQVFVDPKPSTSGKYFNSLIRCTWSPSVCLVERRASIHLLDDPKHSMYERAETFEGTFRNSEEFPLTSITLLDDIQHRCLTIVNHFLNIARTIAVKRMVLNFKFDTRGLLMFLWCESLRLVRDMSVPHRAPVVVGTDGKLPEFNLDNKLKLPSRLRQGVVFDTCSLCDRAHSIFTMFRVKYRTILASYNEIHNPAGTGCNWVEDVVALRHMKEQEATRINRTWEEAIARPKASKRSRPWREKKKEEKAAPEWAPPIDVVDATLFTEPNKEHSGLLSKIDNRILLHDPMEALNELTYRLADIKASEEQNTEAKKQELKQISSTLASQQIQIPWFIRKLHPYMTIYDYIKVRARDDFQNIEAQMCGTCFLTITKQFPSIHTMTDTMKEALSRKPKLKRFTLGYNPLVNKGVYRVTDPNDVANKTGKELRPLRSCLMVPMSLSLPETKQPSEFPNSPSPSFSPSSSSPSPTSNANLDSQLERNRTLSPSAHQREDSQSETGIIETPSMRHLPNGQSGDIRQEELHRSPPGSAYSTPTCDSSDSEGSHQIPDGSQLSPCTDKDPQEQEKSPSPTSTATPSQSKQKRKKGKHKARLSPDTDRDAGSGASSVQDEQQEAKLFALPASTPPQDKKQKKYFGGLKQDPHGIGLLPLSPYKTSQFQDSLYSRSRMRSKLSLTKRHPQRSQSCPPGSCPSDAGFSDTASSFSQRTATSAASSMRSRMENGHIVVLHSNIRAKQTKP